MRKIDKIVGISLFSLTGLGLAGYLVYNRVAKLIGNNFGIKTLRVQEASLTKLRMSVYFNFKNATDMQIVLSKQQYEFYLNGVYLTTMKSNKLWIKFAFFSIPITIPFEAKIREWKNG